MQNNNNYMIPNMMQNQQQRQQTQQQRINNNNLPPQQAMHTVQVALPQAITPRIRGPPKNSNNLYGYQQSSSPNVVSTNRPRTSLNAATSSQNLSIPSPQTLANIGLKKLPFYEIHSEIMKPINLIGIEKCTLRNASSGMKEGTYKFTLLPTQVNAITMNRNVVKNEYIYQVQIRICMFEAKSTEVTDYMPLDLSVRVNGHVCSLLPVTHNTRPGTPTRRPPGPINCSQFIKLNPNIANYITVNWFPDEKNYVMAAYIVKRLSVNTLLQKLYDKKARSAKDTRNDIIKKFAEVDPDLATTSFRFSLICPLGKMKMKIPAKSTKCNHLQCFDAHTFILMNAKKPTWMCPTCDKPCLYDDIKIETYFLDIIRNPTLGESCKEIEILADGSWIKYKESEEINNTQSTCNTNQSSLVSINLDDSDDDNPTEDNSKPEKDNGSEMLLVDLTLSDGDEDRHDSNKNGNDGNEAQATDAVQPVNINPQTQVQPQQAVTSSELILIN